MKILSTKRYNELLAEIKDLQRDREENLARSVTIANLTHDLEMARADARLARSECVVKDSKIEELKGRLTRKGCTHKKDAQK